MVASKADLARWAYTSIFYRQGNRIFFRCGICAFHGKQRSLPKPRPLPNTPAAPLAGKERCEAMSKRQGCFSISKKNCFRIVETITFVTYQPCGVLFLLWNRNCYSAVDSICDFSRESAASSDLMKKAILSAGLLICTVWDLVKQRKAPHPSSADGKGAEK